MKTYINGSYSKDSFLKEINIHLVNVPRESRDVIKPVNYLDRHRNKVKIYMVRKKSGSRLHQFSRSWRMF